MKDSLDILLLIVIANAAPVLASILFSHRASLAIDFGIKLNDQQYLFGNTKTWRGLISSILVTSIAAYTLGYTFLTGLIIATLAMLGDLLSSFIKRRLKKASSTNAILLDQLPESALPALAIMKIHPLALTQVIAIVICFIIIELVLSSALRKFQQRHKQL